MPEQPPPPRPAQPSREPVDWESCHACMGSGWFHDCMEDSCCCAEPDDPLGPFAFDCEECKGEGELPVYERSES